MKNFDAFILKYTDAANLHGEASKEGNYQLANKQYRILAKMYKQLEKDRIQAEKIIEKLFEHTNPSVRIWAAADAINLGILGVRAKSILQQISEDHSIGVLRLSAEMTLKEWEKRKRLETLALDNKKDEPAD